jgi:hypothetical protein
LFLPSGLRSPGVEANVGGGAVRDLRAGGGLLRRRVRRADHVVGGAVLAGGPLGAVAANARGARMAVPPSAATAPAPADPMMNLRRVNPGFPADSALNDSVTS